MKNIFVCLIIVFFSLNALAQNHFEIEYAHSDLTNDFKDWNDVNIRTYVDRWVFEADYKNHFAESAWVLGATFTHDYSPLWYQDFSASFGSNTKILPAWVLFSELHRKFFESQALVAGLGFGYTQSADPYSDFYGIGELTYYFPEFFSIQAGTRLNQSSPGSVFTSRYFGLINFLHPGLVEAFIKFDIGKEGYTVLGANQFKNEFSSTLETVSVRYWFMSTRGLSLTGEFYQNPFYNRETVSIGYLQVF